LSSINNVDHIQHVSQLVNGSGVETGGNRLLIDRERIPWQVGLGDMAVTRENGREGESQLEQRGDTRLEKD
jgi:hypothetical protein